MKKRKMLRATTMLISALVIIALLLGTYFLFYMHLATYESRLEVMQKELLVNFQSKTDEVIDSCTRFIAASLLEESVIQFATEKELDNFNVYVMNKFFSRGYLSPEVDCLFGVFRPDRDIFITNSGVLYSWDLTKKYGFVPEIMEELQKIPKQTFANNFYLAENLSVDNGRLNLFLKRSMPNDSKTEMYGFISLNLKSVAKQLSQRGDNVFFTFKDGEIYFSSQPEIELKRMQMLYEPSKRIYGLEYATGVIKQQEMLLPLIYILVFFPLAAVGIYGSSFLAKRLNRPIENILRQLSDDNAEDIYDEEAYIRNRFVEINAISQKLEEKNSFQERYVRQSFIRDLLYGVADEGTLPELAERCGLSGLRGHVALAVLDEKKNEAQGVMFFQQIVALMEAKIEDSVVVFLGSEIVVIARQMAFDAFKKEITQAILQIEEWYNVCYIGSLCEGDIKEPKELAALFNVAMRYLQSSGFGYDTLVITEDDLKGREEYAYYYPLEFERSIIDCFASGDFERGLQIVQMILHKNLFEMKLGKAALVELKFAFVGTLKRILQVLNKPESELFGEGSILYLELSACKTAEEIADKIYEMFSTVQSCMSTAYDATDHALIGRLEQYIQENYAREDMSLLLLAEHFNMTAGYISKIFKKCHQNNFKEYLSAYRIQKATEILEKQPHIRIVDVAREVGYENVNSFIRNFKKLKQISPGEYKKAIIDSKL